MDFFRSNRGALLASILCCAVLSPGTSQAVSFSEFVDPNPAPGNQFGRHVVPLSTGNVVITSPFDDAGGTDVGAVYLFNGATGALISSLRGSTANDAVGVFGVTALSNGNYVVRSSAWDNGAAVDAGAVTWGSGTTGVSGVVSAANSLVGSTANERVGVDGVMALSNGNYVVRTVYWDNGSLIDRGAVTWGSGTSGVSGVVSAANSLIGARVGDQVGINGVVELSNGNYVVLSPNWDNGAVVNAGAVTWGNGITGVSGVVSAANSLVGSTVNDVVGYNGVTPLRNGNYVVMSGLWNNGGMTSVGAATWGNGMTGVTGVVSAANSLVGAQANDVVGNPGVTELSNSNYVVACAYWDNGSAANAGAVTWGSGTTGVSGVVSAANSLVGSTAEDNIGAVTALSNGNYVVRSLQWDNGAVVDAGVATWCDGTTGRVGAVSAANSLVGSTAGDQVSQFVQALPNGNYVVSSPRWNNGSVVDVGAVTLCNGASVTSGVVSAANSLIGSTGGDKVGLGAVTVLTNGNYVVRSPDWWNGPAFLAGAATWGSGTTGVIGVVSTANSLVGSNVWDGLDGPVVTALSNGNYVVGFPKWDNGPAFDAGAVTWGSGTTGVTGVVSAANSLVGSTVSDLVGNGGVTVLSNGNYVVTSSNWDNGAVNDASAVTWGSGMSGVSGVISPANSLIGSRANEVFGFGVTPLSNGNYVVGSPGWDNGGLLNAGAATWGRGTTGVSGVISAANSMVGTTDSTNLQPIVLDDVNGTFIARYLAEGGGRVRVGSQDQPNVDVADNEAPVQSTIGVRPNPARGNALHVAFALPTGGPARLELLDVSGRRLLARDVSSLGSGQHSVNLAEGRKVAPGIYWVRLTQGASQQKARVAVIE